MKNKKIFYLCIILFITSCGPFIGGYSGQSYNLEPTNKVYFDFKTKTISLNFLTKKHLSFYIYFENIFMFKDIMDTSGNVLFYKLPDTILSKRKNENVKIEIINNYVDIYSINIRPSNWINKDTLNGFYRKY